MKTIFFSVTRHQRYVLSLVITIAVIGVSLPDIAFPIECPPRKERPKEFDHYITWKVVSDVAAINLVGYAGDGPDPRPLTKKSIGDIRRDRELELRWSPGMEQLFGLAGYRFFAFHDDRLQSHDDEVVTVPRSVLWCFVHEGDLVLLSDRNTHHYTQVHRVDRAGKRIIFADPWPDRFFLLEGRNTAEVRAKLIDPDMKAVHDKLEQFKFKGMDEETSKAYHRNAQMWGIIFTLSKEKPTQVVEITESEFNRVALGVVTFDSFDVVDEYLEVTSNPTQRVKALLSFAASASRSEEALLGKAADLATRARRIADASGDKQLQMQAAGRMLFLSLFQYYGAVEKGNATEARSQSARIKALQEESPINGLYAFWGALDFYRMGNAAGRANVPHAAIDFFSRAIDRDPSLEEAYLYRAVGKGRVSDFTGVWEDTTYALKLNARRTAEVELRKLERHPKDVPGISSDQAELASLRDRRLITLEQRAISLVPLGRCTDGQDDMEQLMAAQKSSGFAVSARCDLVAGRIIMGKKKLEAAISLEQNSAKRGLYEEILRNLPRAQ